MLMDKSTLEEQQPAYIGMYEGKLMDEAVREYVESCDAVVLIGAILTVSVAKTDSGWEISALQVVQKTVKAK
jgi:TPP-dependent 2-oxoacid decarboxylase